MSNYKVVSACKDDRGVILGIACSDGSHFKRATAASMIDSGHYFYTEDFITKKVARVHTFVEHNTKFIKTAADGVWTNNLDNLPICGDCSKSVWS